jgi:diacylglycerol kinase family enzyme
MGPATHYAPAQMTEVTTQVTTRGLAGDPPRALVLLNRRSGTLAASGTGDEGGRIAAGFAAAGVAADVRFVDPARLAAEVAASRAGGTADAIVVGGGDGTINTVANAVAGSSLTFAVLPLGTHNHFAKELGVPDDLEAAVAALADCLRTGRGVGPLDVAEVNGHLFLNFSGVGLHPAVVERREVDHAQIKRWAVLRAVLRKFTKPLALIVSFVRSLRDLPIYRLTLEANGQRVRRFTPSVIVCTNAHQIEVFGLTDVSVPQRDVLNAYVARTRSAAGLIRLVLAAATRRLGKLKEFEAIAACDLTIGTRRPTLRVSVDGEVLRLRTPLRYRIRTAALTVVAPARAGEAVAEPGVPAPVPA